jgi:hypothetical protein
MRFIERPSLLRCRIPSLSVKGCRTASNMLR